MALALLKILHFLSMKYVTVGNNNNNNNLICCWRETLHAEFVKAKHTVTKHHCNASHASVHNMINWLIDQKYRKTLHGHRNRLYQNINPTKHDSNTKLSQIYCVSRQHVRKVFYSGSTSLRLPCNLLQSGCWLARMWSRDFAKERANCK